MRARGLILALVSGVIAGTHSFTAAAQPATQVTLVAPLPARLQPLWSQLIAVQSMTTVRTSGKADAAMVARIDALDAQLRASRLALEAINVSATSARAQAQAAIEAVRVRYQREAEALFTQLQLATTERDRYRQDLASVLIAASPSELDAQRRFGDGDFSVFDPMEAAILARQGAEQVNLRRQQGVQLRQLAQNYATMVAQGTPGRTSGELLVRWDRAAAADPNDFWTHIERLRLVRITGVLGHARTAAVDAGRAAQEEWQRGVVMSELGDIALLQGDLAAARAAFGECTAIYRRMVNARPNEVWLRANLSAIVTLLGNVEMRMGDIGAARLSYAESLAISRALLVADPTSLRAKRDVFISQNKLGDVAMEYRDLDAAYASYTECLIIARELAVAEPSSARAKRFTSVALERLGDLALARGDHALAHANYSQSVGIFRALSAADPTSAEAKRDVSVSLNKIGDVALLLGNIDTGQAAYDESLAVRRALSVANPTSADAKRDVSVSLIKQGDIAKRPGDLIRARTAYFESLAIQRTLAIVDPTSMLARRDVAGTLWRLAALPDSGVSWLEVAAWYREMRVNGKLSLTDAQFLRNAEQLAATPPNAIPPPQN